MNDGEVVGHSVAVRVEFEKVHADRDGGADLVVRVGRPVLAVEVKVISEEVTSAATRAMSLVDVRYPSIWLLDPFTPEQLPWSVVEAIANFSSVYPDKSTGEPVTRRPELIITLMTHALQRNVRENPKLVTTALGLGEDS